MDIKSYYLSAIEQIKTDETKQISNAKEKIRVEIVNPFNSKIEKEKAEAIAKRTAEFEQDKANLLKQYNEKLLILQQKCEQDKKLINDTCETKKAEYAENAYKTATAEIEKRAEKAIADLNNLIGKVKE